MPAEKIKTDRPDEQQEAMRNLVRTRDDLKEQERKTRQQLNVYLQCHGHSWPSSRVSWTKTHYNWLEELIFPHPTQQIVLQEYIKRPVRRIADITVEVERERWSLAPVVEALVALRGVDRLAATILLAELGYISRFDSPR